jgi:hypothetical protein
MPPTSGGTGGCINGDAEGGPCGSGLAGGGIPGNGPPGIGAPGSGVGGRPIWVGCGGIRDGCGMPIGCGGGRAIFISAAAMLLRWVSIGGAKGI